MLNLLVKARVSMRKYSTDELNKMDKQTLITLFESLQNQLITMNAQLEAISQQLALMNQRSFGRKTEKMDQIANQLSLFDVFNEPEVLSDNSREPEITEIVVSTHTRKKKTKREDKLEGLPARVFEHRIEEEELHRMFPFGYKELPSEVYKRLYVIPQTFMVDEHHIHVYASRNNDGTIVRASRPKDVFRNSIVTPALLSTIVVGKYANHIPLERQSQCYKDYGVELETNTMANWMIKGAEQYFSILYDELHNYLYKSNIIHADETPFTVIKDGRKAGTDSYMWVYRNGACDAENPVVIYDYQQTRKTDHPREFLKGYSGIVVTDGYQVYHSLEKQREDLQVAGCWIHAKRKFAEIVKTSNSEDLSKDNIVAAEAVRRISKMFHEDNQLDNLSKADKEKQRGRLLKPLVDDFFAWAKETISKLPADGATHKGLQYCINQEKYLRVFLSNGYVPMDNNRAEQAIRPFTIGRKNWVNIYSPNGAGASAILYSIIETAKANRLRLNDYIEYAITELVNHQDDTNRDFLKDLLPWSDIVQEKFHSTQKS